MANHLQVGKTYRLNNDVFLCQRTMNGEAWFLRDLNKSRTWNGSGHVQGYLIDDKGEVQRFIGGLTTSARNSRIELDQPIRQFLNPS